MNKALIAKVGPTCVIVAAIGAELKEEIENVSPHLADCNFKYTPEEADGLYVWQGEYVENGKLDDDFELIPDNENFYPATMAQIKEFFPEMK